MKSRVGRVAQWVRSLVLTTHTSLWPIRRGFAPGFVNYKKGCTRLAAASEKVYQLLAHGRWFSPGSPASSTTKTGRHDVAEILLKVALSTKNQIKSMKSNKPHTCRRCCNYKNDGQTTDRVIPIISPQTLFAGDIIKYKCWSLKDVSHVFAWKNYRKKTKQKAWIQCNTLNYWTVKLRSRSRAISQTFMYYPRTTNMYIPNIIDLPFIVLEKHYLITKH